MQNVLVNMQRAFNILLQLGQHVLSGIRLVDSVADKVMKGTAAGPTDYKLYDS